MNADLLSAIAAAAEAEQAYVEAQARRHATHNALMDILGHGDSAQLQAIASVLRRAGNALPGGRHAPYSDHFHTPRSKR